jgi:hypothetical protein
MTLPWLWLQFALCATLILVAGSRLARSGDRIAATTGLTGSLIGLALPLLLALYLLAMRSLYRYERANGRAAVAAATAATVALPRE